jgi:hypothetical protein
MKSSLLRLRRLSGLDERRRWVDRDYSCALHSGVTSNCNKFTSTQDRIIILRTIYFTYILLDNPSAEK